MINKRKFTCYPRTAEGVPSAKEYNAFLEAFAEIVGFEYAGDWEAFKTDPKNAERADFFAAGFKANRSDKKVYVLMRSYCGDASEVIGVYDNKDSAESEAICINSGTAKYHVKEMIVSN